MKTVEQNKSGTVQSEKAVQVGASSSFSRNVNNAKGHVKMWFTFLYLAMFLRFI